MSVQLRALAGLAGGASNAKKPPSYDAIYNRDVLFQEAKRLFPALNGCASLEHAREYLTETISRTRSDVSSNTDNHSGELIRSRDCGRALLTVLSERSEVQYGFSVAEALWDIASGRPREDLQTSFHAELINWIRGLEGLARCQYMGDVGIDSQLTGRDAALVRSAELDRLWATVESKMARFGNGLSQEAQVTRQARKQHIIKAFEATEDQWNDWHWQLGNLITNGDALSRLVSLTDVERYGVDEATKGKLPFAVTPYYVALMDEPGGGRDQAIRAQVIPPPDYVDWMTKHRGARKYSCDFMLESDTSPIDLVTRRYPAVAILKPCTTCPQICVYCQRNWEIDQAMSPDALANEEEIEAAVGWIENHRAIREVLITGGDPLVLSDDELEKLIGRVAAIPHVDFIRIGTRTPVTLPMRITEELASMLGGFREIGRRDVAVVTHIEHPYEVTHDTAVAVDRLRRNGIGVYNQHVYTFFTSRRFESAMLRMLLRPIGIDPYYTFAPKGKEETNQYRVPIARLMQEQKEEARLMPGMRRTDEVVYNVPGLGKNYLRALQHRDLITVLPDGARVYEFHPWEKNLVQCDTYLTTDVPILEYLMRLAEIGEDPTDYESIWFYF